MPKITLPDGQEKEFPLNTVAQEIVNLLIRFMAEEAMEVSMEAIEAGHLNII